MARINEENHKLYGMNRLAPLTEVPTGALEAFTDMGINIEEVVLCKRGNGEAYEVHRRVRGTPHAAPPRYSEASVVTESRDMVRAVRKRLKDLPRELVIRKPYDKRATYEVYVPA